MMESATDTALAGQRLTLPADLERAVEARLRAWDAAAFGRRLWAGDPTLWADRPLPELADRLGWLRLPEASAAHLDVLRGFVAEVRRAGFTRAVLLGMGGSSLAPEVFARTFGCTPSHLDLIVLDSTHPDAIRAVEAPNLSRTLFIVSSKSGTTIETDALTRYFWARVAAGSPAPGDQFVAITDAGTPLERLATDRAFRRVFLAPTDVGGRYSALSVFGLVPAALLGADLAALLAQARLMAAACGPGVPAAENPGLVLGAVLGEAARAGRDKLTFFTSPGLVALPVWIEQLIAESTGKDGTGIVPVAGEPPGRPSDYADDRLFVLMTLEGESPLDVEVTAAALQTAGHPVVRIRVPGPYAVGQEIFRWEVATAAAGAVLGIHPFNQPDVQLAKDLAQRAMTAGDDGGGEDARAAAPEAGEVVETLRTLLRDAGPGHYLAVQAYLPQEDATAAAIEEIRRAVRDRLRLATTGGYGPRFLHSTGQLHKGGPATGRFLQLVDTPAADLPVPETGTTFGRLIAAQARGDLEALRQRGRRVARLSLGADRGAGLRVVTRAIVADLS